MAAQTNPASLANVRPPRPCLVHGKRYPSVRAAAAAWNCTHSGTHYRLTSANYPDWSYADA